MTNLSPAEYRREVNRAMTEKQLQKHVEMMLRESGAYVYHTYDSRRSSPGYPDVTTVTRDGRLAFFELKSEKGRLSKAQKEWLERLSQMWGVWTVAVIRPSDLDWLADWIEGVN